MWERPSILFDFELDIVLIHICCSPNAIPSESMNVPKQPHDFPVYVFPRLVNRLKYSETEIVTQYQNNTFLVW
jgi:hypothetical protein